MRTSKPDPIISNAELRSLRNSVILELYKSGMTCRAIAAHFAAKGIEISHQVIGKVVKNAGISRPHSEQKHSALKPRILIKQPDILDLRSKGLSQQAIARQLGISHISVKRVLQLNGLDTKQGYRNRWEKKNRPKVDKII